MIIPGNGRWHFLFGPDMWSIGLGDQCKSRWIDRYEIILFITDRRAQFTLLSQQISTVSYFIKAHIGHCSLLDQE